jgi:hypothetical protein
LKSGVAPDDRSLTALAFSIYENKGVYCLLLGSGVSRPAEIPTGWEITLDLVRRVAALQGVTGELADYAGHSLDLSHMDPDAFLNAMIASFDGDETVLAGVISELAS